MSENDQPYSVSWESYSVVDLIGGSHLVEHRSAQWEEVFNEIKPSCPKCGASLTSADFS